MPRRIGKPDFIFGTSATGFCGYSISKRTLDQRIVSARQATGHSEPMKPWTLHDLRRSCATGMGERLGIAPHIVEAILNHVSGHKAGIAGVYNRATYENEKRAALDKWADHVLATVDARSSNIVSLRA
jgi:integrase